ETVTGTGEQSDAVAAGGELLGELGGESGAGTGDQGGRHGVSLTGKISAGRASRSTGRDHASGPARSSPAARPEPDLPQRPAYSVGGGKDRKSTRLNSSHVKISYAVFCL